MVPALFLYTYTPLDGGEEDFSHHASTAILQRCSWFCFSPLFIIIKIKKWYKKHVTLKYEHGTKQSTQQHHGNL